MLTKAKVIQKTRELIASALDISGPAKVPEFLAETTTENLEKISKATSSQEIRTILKFIIDARKDEESSDSETDSEATDDDQAPSMEPPAQKSRSAQMIDVNQQLQLLTLEVTRLRSLHQTTQQQPPMSPQYYTQDISRWRTAFEAGTLHELTAAWLAGSFRRTEVGEPLRQALRNTADTLLKLMKEKQRPADPHEAWRGLEPLVVRLLSHEAASSLFLQGGLQVGFVGEATDALVAEGPAIWTGPSSTIAKRVDEQTRHLLAYHKFHAPNQGGRPHPRQGRRPGVGGRGRQAQGGQPKPTERKPT